MEIDFGRTTNGNIPQKTLEEYYCQIQLVENIDQYCYSIYEWIEPLVHY